MKVKIKKLNELAVIPTYAHNTDAGLDLTAISYEYDSRIDCHIYGTGLAIEIPEGYVGLLFPRSSNRKTDSYLSNSVGVIDAGYRGEVMVSFKTRDRRKEDEIPETIAPYNIGSRVAQLIIMPYPKIEFVKVDKLSDSDRGDHGHGSTDDIVYNI